MIALKKIQNSDISNLEELSSFIWREAYVDLLGKNQVEYMIKKYQSKEAFTVQLESGYEYYYIMYNDSVAGYVGILEEENKLFLSKLYLKREYHGNGIAQRVLAMLVEMSKERALSSIYLTVNKGNVKAIRAYERFGFKRTDSIVTDIGGGYVMDDYIYEKNTLV